MDNIHERDNTKDSTSLQFSEDRIGGDKLNGGSHVPSTSKANKTTTFQLKMPPGVVGPSYLSFVDVPHHIVCWSCILHNFLEPIYITWPSGLYIEELKALKSHMISRIQ